MADNSNDFDDEYQFNDLDNIDSGLEENLGEAQSDSTRTASNPINFASNDIKRKVLIGVGVVILALAVYKFMGAFFSSSDSSKTVAKSQSRPSLPTQTISQPVQQSSLSQVPVSQIKSDPEIKQKLNRLEFGAESNKNTLNNVKNNISSLQTTLDSLNLKISQLNNNISNLTEQVERQQQQIMALKRKPKKRVKPVRRVVKPRLNYAIQAIIPGRAWLMATNGTTITVSEGSSVPGYGRVKLIDPHQGIVVMSNGKTIKFSSSDT